MAIKPYSPVPTQDRVLGQAQEGLTRAIADVARSGIVDGILLQNVSLSAGANMINHKLGRKLVGWQIVRQRGSATPTKLITPWGDTPWTPTGTWVTNATYAGLWRRVGDTMEVDALIVTSGAVTGSLTLNLPSGVSIDTAKISSTLVGFASAFDSSATTLYQGSVTYSTATSVAATLWSATAPFVWAANDRAAFNFRVPIVGWSVTDSSFVQAYDTQDTNPRPELTLNLVASGAAVVDLYVF